MNMYIYALCDPITSEVRYIGKTSNPYRRYRQHLSARSLNSKKQTYKKCWLKEPPRNPRGLAPRMNWQNNFKNHSTNSK